MSANSKSQTVPASVNVTVPEKEQEVKSPALHGIRATIDTKVYNRVMASEKKSNGIEHGVMVEMALLYLFEADSDTVRKLYELVISKREKESVDLTI